MQRRWWPCGNDVFVQHSQGLAGTNLCRCVTDLAVLDPKQFGFAHVPKSVVSISDVMGPHRWSGSEKYSVAEGMPKILLDGIVKVAVSRLEATYLNEHCCQLETGQMFCCGFAHLHGPSVHMQWNRMP